MFLWTLFIALIFSRSASGVDVKVTAGDEAVFSPTKPLPSPVNSIAWKHISINTVIVIEWDEDGFNAPNDRFKGITTLDEKTGVMKIKRVNSNHIGEYFFEVNSKDQGERFTLIVANRVQKPVIEIESTENPNVVYLRCEYSETIIWRNSAGKTLKGSAISPKGESITVTKNGDPESFYTCSLRNDVSEETSDPIYEKDLFKDVSGGGPWWIVFIIIIPLAAAVGSVLGYKFNTGFRECVQHCPCFKGQGDNDPKTIGYQPTPNNDKDDAEALKLVSTVPNANGPGGNDPKTIDEAPEKTSIVTNTNDKALENTSTVTNTNGPGGNDPKTNDETPKDTSIVTNINDDSTPAANNKSTEGKPDTTEA